MSEVMVQSPYSFFLLFEKYFSLDGVNNAWSAVDYGMVEG